MTPDNAPDVLEQLFILPADAVLVPLAEMSPGGRARLGYVDDGAGQVAVGRPGFRVPTRLITAELAALLGEFREPSRIVDAVLRFSRRRSRNPFETLDDAFDALAAFVNSRVLVPADSPNAEAITATLAPGQDLAGYEVERLVSALEDTEVYLARTAEGKRVAVKIARPGAHDAVAGWLAQEARVLRHLAGRSSPALFELGEYRGRSFLAMEWRPGIPVSVAAQRARATPATARSALPALCRDVLSAYASIHGCGVVHGDIHPGNIIVGDDGRLTVLDFGRSQIVTTTTPGDPEASALVSSATDGTRAGVAYFYEPEFARAIRSGSIPPAATQLGEQYSLAALLYFLLSGVHYLDFSPEHDVLLAQVVDRPPLPFAARGLEPWPAVEATLATALAKDPADRFPSVGHLLDAFDQAARDRGPSSTRRLAPTDVPSRLLDDALHEASWESTPRREMDHLRVEPAGALDLAWFAYRGALARDDFDLLASADVWTCRARMSGSGDRLLEAVSAEIHRSRGDPGAQAQSVIAFASACERMGDHVDLVEERCGALATAARVLDGLADGEIDSGPLGRWTRRTVDGIWQMVDAWGPLTENPQLPHLGMAHGWAGLLYATLRACRSTTGPRPPGLAARLEQLADLAQPSGRGVRWIGTIRHPRVGTWSPSLAPGWCSGSAGHALLWALAYEELGDERFRGLAEGAGWYAADHPADNPNFCCGTTGRGFAMLRLYQLTGEAMWLAQARRLAGSAAARWGERTEPRSLRTGPLGTALLLLELEAPERAVLPIFGR